MLTKLLSTDSFTACPHPVEIEIVVRLLFFNMLKTFLQMPCNMEWVTVVKKRDTEAVLGFL